MKVVKNKKILLSALVLLLLIAASLLFLVKLTVTTEKQVKVVDYGYSVCTQDVPSSSCSQYEVNVQTTGGDKFTYKVAGFDNRKSEQYDEITSHITKAKEQNTAVILKVDNKGFITAVGQ